MSPRAIRHLQRSVNITPDKKYKFS
jgi:hypothetical protein